MRPRERSETGEQDLFRSRLDQIIDMKHPLVALGRNHCYRSGHCSDQHATIAFTRDERTGWSGWYSVIAGDA